jgi:hypothetical protein
VHAKFQNNSVVSEVLNRTDGNIGIAQSILASLRRASRVAYCRNYFGCAGISVVVQKSYNNQRNAQVLFIYILICFCLTCFGLSLSPSSRGTVYKFGSGSSLLGMMSASGPGWKIQNFKMHGPYNINVRCTDYGLNDRHSIHGTSFSICHLIHPALSNGNQE